MTDPSAIPEFLLAVTPEALAPKELLGLEDDEALDATVRAWQSVEDFLRDLTRRLLFPVLPQSAPDLTGLPPGSAGWWLDAGGDTLNVAVLYPDGVTIKTAAIPLT